MKFLKGGGPYGQGVTRGQDLSGKDFSGQTLIRQDFKTVYIILLSTVIGHREDHIFRLIISLFDDIFGSPS